MRRYCAWFAVPDAGTSGPAGPASERGKPAALAQVEDRTRVLARDSIPEITDGPLCPVEGAIAVYYAPVSMGAPIRLPHSVQEPS